MSTVPSSAGRDPAKLCDHPTGPDATTVALKPALARRQRGIELLVSFVLVLAVGEQDGVADAPRCPGEQLVGAQQPGPDRRPAIRHDPQRRRSRLAPGLRRGHGEPAVEWVHGQGLVRTRDDGEQDPVANALHGRGRRLLGGVELGPGVGHRARCVDDHDLGGARPGARPDIRDSGTVAGGRVITTGGHSDDRVDLGGALREVLVRKHLGDESAHLGPPVGSISMTATVMLSRPPRVSAVSVRDSAIAAGDASAGMAVTSSWSSPTSAR